MRPWIKEALTYLFWGGVGAGIAFLFPWMGYPLTAGGLTAIGLWWVGNRFRMPWLERAAPWLGIAVAAAFGLFNWFEWH